MSRNGKEGRRPAVANWNPGHLVVSTHTLYPRPEKVGGFFIEKDPGGSSPRINASHLASLDDSLPFPERTLAKPGSPRQFFNRDSNGRLNSRTVEPDRVAAFQKQPWMAFALDNLLLCRYTDSLRPIPDRKRSPFNPSMYRTSSRTGLASSRGRHVQPPLV